MKTRLSVSQRTAPLPCAAIEAWGFAEPTIDPTTYRDNPALKRLISLGLGAVSLWLLVTVFWQAWPALFPSEREVLTHETARATNPIPAPRAELYQDPPPVPAPAVGESFSVQLPDGRVLKATFRGWVTHFGDLPLHPKVGDQYRILEGDGQSAQISWVWFTPLGWNHPAWIDP